MNNWKKLLPYTPGFIIVILIIYLWAAWFSSEYDAKASKKKFEEFKTVVVLTENCIKELEVLDSSVKTIPNSCAAMLSITRDWTEVSLIETAKNLSTVEYNQYLALLVRFNENAIVIKRLASEKIKSFL